MLVAFVSRAFTAYPQDSPPRPHGAICAFPKNIYKCTKGMHKNHVNVNTNVQAYSGHYAIFRAMRKTGGGAHHLFRLYCSDRASAIELSRTRTGAGYGSHRAREAVDRQRVHRHHPLDAGPEGSRGNEIADSYAKWAAEAHLDLADRD